MSRDQTQRSWPWGLAPFESGRAEEEGEWLDECLVLPPEFNLIARLRSAVIFASGGAGKTALCRAVLRRLSAPEVGALCARTRFMMPRTRRTGTPMVGELMAGMLDALVQTWLGELSRRPQVYAEAPDWSRDLLAWLMNRFLRVDPGYFSEQMGDPNGIIQASYARNADHLGLDDAGFGSILQEVVKALQAMGWGGTCVLIDDVVAGGLENGQSVREAVHAWLSTLVLFQQHGFALHFFADPGLKESIETAGAVERQRVETYWSIWQQDSLQKMIERRLDVASGGQVKGLDDLCAPELDERRQGRTLAEQIEYYAGDSPRRWLSVVRPLVARYLERAEAGLPGPLPAEEWQEIIRGQPLSLKVDTDTGEVYVGPLRVTDELGPLEYAILKFLYRRRNTVCSRYEVHIEVYEKLFPDEHFAGEVDYRKMDSAIWRIRRAVEPNPKRPLFVETVHGRGYRLQPLWPGSGRRDF